MRKGFTLVEVLIVMAVLMIMLTILIGILNSGALVDRGKDARRKKDVGRIRVAIEEYYNNNNCYPGALMVAEMNNDASCGGTITGFNELSPWPCDPNGGHYYVFVEQSNCPSWFKVLTKLENDKDSDIPAGWATNNYMIGDGSIDSSQANFGKSSTNVSWYDYVLSTACSADLCNIRVVHANGTTGCDATQGFCQGECYMDNGCTDLCAVPCCGPGCDIEVVFR